VRPSAEVVSTVGPCVIVRLRWRPRDADTDDQYFQILRLQDDKIREMADGRTMAQATKVAKKLAAGTEATG
jgi:hypothetical protein